MKSKHVVKLTSIEEKRQSYREVKRIILYEESRHIYVVWTPDIATKI